LDQFGSIAKLPIGILFSANGTTPELVAEASIQSNGDAMLISSRVAFDAVKQGATEATAIYGSWDFTETYNENAPIILAKDLRIIVRDDLRLMDYFRVSCHGIILEKSDV